MEIIAVAATIGVAGAIIGTAVKIIAVVEIVVAAIPTGVVAIAVHEAMGVKTTAIPALEKLLVRQFANLCVKQHVTECRRELRNTIVDATEHFLTHHIRF